MAYHNPPALPLAPAEVVYGARLVVPHGFAGVQEGEPGLRVAGGAAGEHLALAPGPRAGPRVGEHLRRVLRAPRPPHADREGAPLLGGVVEGADPVVALHLPAHPEHGEVVLLAPPVQPEGGRGPEPPVPVEPADVRAPRPGHPVARASGPRGTS